MTYDKRRIEKSQYVLGVTPSTLDAPIAAQASDEPMDYAEQLRAAVETVCEGWTLPPGARKTLETALWAPQVSPRATADVERDAARYRFRKQFLENGGAIMWTRDRCQFRNSGEMVSMGTTEEDAIDAAIATTKPGA